MDTRKQQLDNFFDRYTDRFNKALQGADPDIEATVNSFSGCFIEASPSGVNCGKNDEQFRKLIPQGYAFYKSIGITSLEILSKEIILLNEDHAMAIVHWQSGFRGKDNSKGTIKFDVIYLLQTKESGYKIFAYITGDEQKALKENGLV